MKDHVMLSDENLKAKLKENFPWTGVYKLQCISEDGKNFIPIERVAKTDSIGVLYIGVSDYIPNRVCELRTSIFEATVDEPLKSRLFQHTCGKKYANRVIQNKFPVERLCIQVIPSDKEKRVDSHYILESEELRKYESEFGEPPPLNEGRR